jgi:hypothetical protein
MFHVYNERHLHVKSKAILVIGRGGLWGCEMLRIPHFPDSRFTDGGEVSLTHRSRSSVSVTHFC